MFNIRNLFQDKALVLMYHKISTPLSDPWELAVTPENFEAQLKILKEKHAVIAIDELTDNLKRKKVKRKTIAITFDDGYVNNFTVAKPLLEGIEMPASFFITDNNLVSQQPFWWDELEHIIIHAEQLPQMFLLNVEGFDLNFNLNDEAILNDTLKVKHQHFVAYEPPTLRAELYFKLWQLMSPLRKEKQSELLQNIKDWAGIKSSDLEIEKCMSLEQLRAMASNRLYTIGGHTRSHPALSHHSKKVQLEEVSTNKAFLEKELNQQIQFFAYPSGNFNDVSIEVMQDLGYEAAFTTNPIPVKRKTNHYKVSRFQVNNWNGENFERKLQHWFNL